MDQFKKVSPECKMEVRLVAELQAEDFHLDRALYFACKADREVLCPDVAAGEGRVYNCLFDKKSDPAMSPSVRCFIYLLVTRKWDKWSNACIARRPFSSKLFLAGTSFPKSSDSPPRVDANSSLID